MTRPILEVPKAWNNYHLASASYEGALRGGNLDRARKWLNEAAEELESAIAQQAVAAEREKYEERIEEARNHLMRITYLFGPPATNGFESAQKLAQKALSALAAVERNT